MTELSSELSFHVHVNAQSTERLPHTLASNEEEKPSPHHWFVIS